MEKFAGHWAGRIFGTNTGNIAIKFEEDEPALLKGTLRLLDDTYGVAVFDITGTKDQGGIRFDGVPVASVEGVVMGSITARASFGAKYELVGEWSSSIGTGGTFVVHPHHVSGTAINGNDSPSQVAASVPEQIYAHSAVLGALSLYSDDIRMLIANLEKDFSNPRPVVTFSNGKGETVKFAEEFLDDLAKVHTLNYLQVQVQERELNGINKIVVVELRRHGVNEIRVQGSNESWVIGRVESILANLNQRRSWIVSSYKRIGHWFNQLVFYSMIVVIVGVADWQLRAGLALGVFALLTLFSWIHAALVPDTVIRLGGFKPNWFNRYWPSLVSWTLTVIGAVLASLIFWKIQKGLERVEVSRTDSSLSAHR